MDLTLNKEIQFDRERVARTFPSLRLAVRDGATYLSGAFPIEHEGRVLDRFEVAIRIAPLDRSGLPKVYEIGGRIPKTELRHINPDGSACVALPENYFLHEPGPLNIEKFLKGPVRDHFIAQALLERGDPWPYGEWAHGDDGRREFYKKTLGIDDPRRIMSYLKVLAHKQPRGHWPCPCGSGAKLRDCHRRELISLHERVGSKAARRLLSLFYSNPLT